MKNAGLQKVSSFCVPAFCVPASAATLGLVWALGLTAPAAAQGTPQQQQACTPDVMRLCNEFIPDVAKITACMARKRASVSAACRAAFPTASRGKRRISHHRSHHS
jgi:hypothetical protein